MERLALTSGSGCRLLPPQEKGYHDGLTDPEWDRLNEKIKEKYGKTSPMEHWRGQGGRKARPRLRKQANPHWVSVG